MVVNQVDATVVDEVDHEVPFAGEGGPALGRVAVGHLPIDRCRVIGHETGQEIVEIDEHPPDINLDRGLDLDLDLLQKKPIFFILLVLN